MAPSSSFSINLFSNASREIYGNNTLLLYCVSISRNTFITMLPVEVY
jgi:hypothetical protein